VRTPDEISIADIPAKNRKGVSIPKYNVEVQYLLRDPNSYFELPKDKYIICMCHHGVRSATAAFHLRNRGYKSLNLKGGIDAVSNIWDDIEKY
jgi:rhodanese-related sulfurtransferase